MFDNSIVVAHNNSHLLILKINILLLAFNHSRGIHTAHTHTYNTCVRTYKISTNILFHKKKRRHTSGAKIKHKLVIHIIYILIS